MKFIPLDQQQNQRDYPQYHSEDIQFFPKTILDTQFFSEIILPVSRTHFSIFVLYLQLPFYLTHIT